MARNYAERLVASAINNREDSLFSGHRRHGQPIFHHQLQELWCHTDFKGIVKSCYTAVMQYSSTSYDSVFSPVVCATVFTYIRI